MQHKYRHFCFSFCWLQVLFLSQYPFFHLDLSIILPMSGKLEVLGLPRGGRSHGRGRNCPPFQNEKRVWVRWVLLGGLGLLMGSHVGYRVCGYFLYQRTSISIRFSWIPQIAGPLQGTNSFSYPRKGIHRLSRFEPWSSLQRREDLYNLSIFPQWTGGVGFPPPCPLCAETPLTNA